MNFSVYDIVSGRVLHWGTCQDEDLESQAFVPGTAVIEGQFPGDQFYWDGAQMAVFPPRPDGGTWDWASKSWVVDLSAVKAAKWEAMKQARAAAEFAPLVTPYGTFDNDVASQNKVIRTAQLMQTQAQSFAPEAAPTVDFTLADNSVVTLTAGEMVNVALILAAHIQGAYDRGRTVRAEIEACTTPEELAAIAW